MAHNEAQAAAAPVAKPAKAGVSVAYVHDADVTYTWYRALLALISYDQAHGRTVIDNDMIDIKYNAGGLPEARNVAIKRFLQTDSEWLFWLDTDMGFPPNTVDLLLGSADPESRPVVGALCFAYQQLVDVQADLPYEAHLRRWPVPTIYDWTADYQGENGFIPLSPYPINALVQCAGTGSACVLIHRSVFEKLEYGRWYDRVRRGPDAWYGEDLSFCLKAGAAGVPIFVNTAVKTTHQKTTHIDEQQYWETYIAPPAEQDVAVLVPVMKRPDKAEFFMKSLRASSGLCKVYAIHDRDDLETAAAWRKAGATLIDVNEFRDDLDRPGRFSEKINVGFRQTTEPWVFLVGDDVLFYPGWVDQAQMLIGEGKYHVIGTNDLGNASVMLGDHATHMLLSRKYVNEQGGSWDGPGVVCHEGYSHWFVDNEIVQAAKQRGVWTMALGSVVEHLHPAWGKGELDDVYELGQRNVEDDRRLFEQRLREHS